MAPLDGAVADLQAIRDYIGRSSPRYGALVASRLARACSQLPRHPASGRMVPELECPDVRELVRGSYRRLVYRLVGEPDAPDAVAEVVTVFRASRQLPPVETLGLPPGS